MLNASEVLWQVNNEYRKRLNQVHTCLSLLEQLLQHWENSTDTLRGLQYAIGEIDILNGEHRLWRHEFYYDALDTRRMVQSERDIARALSAFHRMRARHETRLQDLFSILTQIQRPDTYITRTSNGDDLWLRTENALVELDSFRDYLQGLNA